MGELVEFGLVELVPDPQSRRAKLVVLTPLGRRTVQDALAVFGELERELTRRIGKRSAIELRRALEADWGRPAARR